MKRMLLALSVSFLAAVAVAGAPPIPPTPAPVELLHVEAVAFAEPLELGWYRDLPDSARATLVVVRADPALVYPRDVAMPVLYAGDRQAVVANRPYPSGVVVALIPGDVDLSQAPIWFGSPELPERVSAETARVERARADAAGVLAASAAEVAARSGEPVRARDLSGLSGRFAELIATFVEPADSTPER